MNNKKKIMNKMSVQIMVVIICAFYHNSLAQNNKMEKKSPLKITGSADIYYTYDFSGKDNIPTSFADNRNSLSIGMLDIALTKSFKNVSFLGEVSFGPRSTKSIPLFSPNGSESGAQIGIQNLHVAYKITKRLLLTAGYMSTFVGYELIIPTGNFNYTTSYLFSAGPFQNAGLKATYTFSNQFSVMLGLFNDWNVYFDKNGINDIGAQIFVLPIKNWDVYLNFLFGSSSGIIFDLTTGYKITDAFYLGLNAADYTCSNNNNGGHSGVSIYPKYTINNFFSLGLRAEFFAKKDVKDGLGVITEASKNVFSTTITGNFKIASLTLLSEIRIDSSDDLGFINKDDNTATNASQITMAAIYSF